MAGFGFWQCPGVPAWPITAPTDGLIMVIEVGWKLAGAGVPDVVIDRAVPPPADAELDTAGADEDGGADLLVLLAGVLAGWARCDPRWPADPADVSVAGQQRGRDRGRRSRRRR